MRPKRNESSRANARSKQRAGAPAEPQARTYSVGYGKPPTSSQFKRGTSGNPKGRPKNRKNLKTLIREALTATIVVQEGTSHRRVSKIEGVVLRQLQNALKGNDRSAMAVIKMATQLGFLEDSANNPAEAPALSPGDEQILQQLLTHRHRTKRR